MRIRIILDSGEATGEIDDSVAGRDLISLLPLTLNMYDLFGREKPGLLPRQLTGTSDGLLSYAVGQIGYWPPSHDIIFFTVDDGKLEIPAPGIVHLGTVTSGLEIIAAAGESFTLKIEEG
jgi:hypothetical protein